MKNEIVDIQSEEPTNNEPSVASDDILNTMDFLMNQNLLNLEDLGQASLISRDSQLSSVNMLSFQRARMEKIFKAIWELRQPLTGHIREQFAKQPDLNNKLEVLYQLNNIMDWMFNQARVYQNDGDQGVMQEHENFIQIYSLFRQMCEKIPLFQEENIVAWRFHVLNALVNQMIDQGILGKEVQLNENNHEMDKTLTGFHQSLVDSPLHDYVYSIVSGEVIEPDNIFAAFAPIGPAPSQYQERNISNFTLEQLISYGVESNDAMNNIFSNRRYNEPEVLTPKPDNQHGDFQF